MSVPPVIIGGGPAGAAAAIALARAGICATMFERLERMGDTICGGFLSWRTVERIAALGIDPKSLGGHDVRELALFIGAREWTAALPAPAMGLSRLRLDNALLDHAEARGVDVRRGVAVRALDGNCLTLASGEAMAPESLFLATGKTDLRGVNRDRSVSGGDPELGLRLRLPQSVARDRLVGGRIELHLFDRGYLGLVTQEDGSVNACMAVRKSRLQEADGKADALLAQLANGSIALADRLGDMPPGTKVDAIGNVPYGWRARQTRSGLYRLGDQAAVIPSVAGEGVGIALASAQSAVEHWLAEGATGALAHQRAFAGRAALPLTLAGFAKGLGSHPALARALIALPGAVGIVARMTRLR